MPRRAAPRPPGRRAVALVGALQRRGVRVSSAILRRPRVRAGARRAAVSSVPPSRICTRRCGCPSTRSSGGRCTGCATRAPSASSCGTSTARTPRRRSTCRSVDAMNHPFAPSSSTDAHAGADDLVLCSGTVRRLGVGRHRGSRPPPGTRASRCTATRSARAVTEGWTLAALRELARRPRAGGGRGRRSRRLGAGGGAGGPSVDRRRGRGRRREDSAPASISVVEISGGRLGDGLSPRPAGGRLRPVLRRGRGRRGHRAHRVLPVLGHRRPRHVVAGRSTARQRARTAACWSTPGTTSAVPTTGELSLVAAATVGAGHPVQRRRGRCASDDVRHECMHAADAAGRRDGHERRR